MPKKLFGGPTVLFSIVSQDAHNCTIPISCGQSHPTIPIFKTETGNMEINLKCGVLTGPSRELLCRHSLGRPMVWVVGRGSVYLFHAFYYTCYY